MKKQFLPADCSRGAPMGRYPYGIASDCPPHSIRLFCIRLRGDYDDGGVYWGGGPESGRLYCARFGNTYRSFIRAASRAEAAATLRIPRAQLRATQGVKE